MTHSTYSKKKSCHFLEGTVCTFLKTEMGKKGRNRSKFRTTVFYKQILDFHCPSKILATHRNSEILSKSLVPTVQPDGQLITHPATSGSHLANFVTADKTCCRIGSKSSTLYFFNRYEQRTLSENFY
jgi:hypothetical protein